MDSFKTHVCMVSQQAAPNLLPLLDNTMKPEKVILLVTPQMRERAGYLEKVIKPRGIQVIQHSIKIEDDFDAMEEQLMNVIDNEPGNDIALNVTGGTKWMAIAAQEVFRMNGSAVFYVKAEDDKVLFLDKERPGHHLSQQIDLKSYIQAYGYEFRDPGQVVGLSQQQREICERLVEKVTEWQGAIGQLNRLASEAEQSNTLHVTMQECASQDSQLMLLLKECEAANLIKGSITTQFSFTSESARGWANGGWLESYVNSKLNELKREGLIQDSPRLNLQIHRVGNTSHNEVDVCFMARNRLHIIECKTKRLAGKINDQAGTETVYKLDSISDLGGLGTKSLLVSYRELKPADRQRAKDLGIKVIQKQEIQQLKSKLRDWINQ